MVIHTQLRFIMNTGYNIAFTKYIHFHRYPLAMKTFSILAGAFFFVAAHTALAQQPTPPTPTAPDSTGGAGSGGLPK